MTGTLYLVGTPIGNMEDLSIRAIKTLKHVDLIASEDTRVTKKILSRFNIKNSIISYHEHNERQMSRQIVQKISKGKNVALVSDAGMPSISDPGQELVKKCHRANIKVSVVPGPTAAISALVLSGLNTGQFTFMGFLSTNKNSRLNTLIYAKTIQNTLIFYEAPHKLIKTLEIMLKFLGNRKICLAKELTKIHEKILICSIEFAIRKFKNSTKTLKGEYVIIVEGLKRINVKNIDSNFEQAVDLAKQLVSNGIKTTEAAKKVSDLTNQNKHKIYLSLVKYKK